MLHHRIFAYRVDTHTLVSRVGTIEYFTIMALVIGVHTTHFRDFTTRVPCVDVKDAPGESAELMVTVKDLNRVAPLHALSLQLPKFVSSDVVASSISITPPDPIVRGEVVQIELG